jgi:hypothetical protein
MQKQLRRQHQTLTRPNILPTNQQRHERALKTSFLQAAFRLPLHSPFLGRIMSSTPDTEPIDSPKLCTYDLVAQLLSTVVTKILLTDTPP